MNLQNVRRETVLQRESLQRQAQAFFDAGLKARIDVVRAEANLYQARADAAGADHDVHTARLILLNQMGIDAPADFELAGAPDMVEAAGTTEDWLRRGGEESPGPRRAALAAGGGPQRTARRAARQQPLGHGERTPGLVGHRRTARGPGLGDRRPAERAAVRRTPHPPADRRGRGGRRRRRVRAREPHAGRSASWWSRRASR